MTTYQTQFMDGEYTVWATLKVGEMTFSGSATGQKSEAEALKAKAFRRMIVAIEERVEAGIVGADVLTAVLAEG